MQPFKIPPNNTLLRDTALVLICRGWNWAQEVWFWTRKCEVVMDRGHWVCPFIVPACGTSAKRWIARVSSFSKICFQIFWWCACLHVRAPHTCEKQCGTGFQSKGSKKQTSLSEFWQHHLTCSTWACYVPTPCTSCLSLEVCVAVDSHACCHTDDYIVYKHVLFSKNAGI